MASARLEHINFTVTDPDRTAKMLCDLFGWKIRWSGPSKYEGYTVHVGTDDQYIALYTLDNVKALDAESYYRKGAVNHIAVLVDDLDDQEKIVLMSGYRTHSHANYEPGRRFYFHDADGIEFEVVSYK